MRTAAEIAEELIDAPDKRAIDPSEHAASFTRWLKLSGFLVRNIKPYELANIKRKVEEMMVDAIRDDRSPSKLTA